MKGFEKWLKNDSTENGIVYNCYHDRDCRKAWKAALEWALMSGVGERPVYNILEELKSAKTKEEP